ncbi:hypothetical protein AcV7_000322 [Taiwanofungus camphoratus]|nr:hypothetical protein AcV7_000322 [Antrodia cinnamomea]
MSTESALAGGGSLRSKPITRSSIRQSLNFSSVGRAIADAMHKEVKENGGEKDKGNKKTKDTSSRRTSAIHMSQMPPRLSTEKPMLKKKEETSPDSKSKTVTRHTRRMSAVKKTTAASSDETSSSPSGAASPKTTVPRSSTLRPRNSNASSALPKYRPKSALVEPVAAKKPPSPVRAGVRRRLSGSLDEEDSDRKSTLSLDPPSGGKLGRPISPLPHRSALKVNLTAAINVRPQTPEKKGKLSTSRCSPSPSSRHGSSTRPSKTAKTSTTASATRSAIPRPPSSASSSTSSQTPRTPKTSTLLTSSSKKTPLSSSERNTPSPLRGSQPEPPESPLGALSARKRTKASPSSLHREFTVATPTPTVFTEGNSTDSIEDVEFLLSSVASPTAPTPALPRFRVANDRLHDDPHTPSRPSAFLPSRANLSYLSPDPPSLGSSPFLRPHVRQPGNDRGSILSWEQLAKHSKTLEDEDVEHMLSEIPAPFRSGAVSPSLSSTLDVPESPTLSALPSPTGYGSISQVLLPDVTPSPAIHNTTARFEAMASDASFEDAAGVTLLRLQLASAESKAQESLAMIESLENQLETAKLARLRDADELSRQISQLEERIHGNLNVDTQRLEYITSLEEQLRQARVLREQVVQEALLQMQQNIEASHITVLNSQQEKWGLVCSAREVTSAWGAVRNTAEGELELIRANRDTLAVLLAGLDQSQRRFSCSSA